MPGFAAGSSAGRGAGSSNPIYDGSVNVCPVTHPIDLLKVRFQLRGEMGSTSRAYKSNNAVMYAVEMIKKEGVLGMYQG